MDCAFSEGLFAILAPDFWSYPQALSFSFYKTLIPLIPLTRNSLYKSMTYLTLRERIHEICEGIHEICEEKHGLCEKNHHLEKVQKFTDRSVANGLRMLFVCQIGLILSGREG